MSIKKEDRNQKKINIEVKEDVASGLYSNLVIVNHSPTEFVFDFATMMPGFPKAKVLSRIVLSPEHAKKFMNALAQNISNYIEKVIEKLIKRVKIDKTNEKLNTGSENLKKYLSSCK